MVSPVPVALAVLLALAQAPPARLVDAVVATVDGVPILASDLELARRTGLAARVPGGTRDLLEARVRLEAAYRDLEGEQLQADVGDSLRALLAAGGGEAALTAAGFPRAAVEALARRVAVVEAYVETRLRPQVEIGDEELAAAYREEVVRPLAARGQRPPPLEAVRPQLERLLVERELNRLVARWLADVLSRHRVEVLRAPPPPADSSSGSTQRSHSSS